MPSHVDVAVLQPGYLPWLGYFDLVALADTFVVYDDVQFDRGGWRNRNRLLRKEGAPQWITAPVIKRGSLSKQNREIELVDARWQRKHLATLRDLYAKAPYFEWCFPQLETYLGSRDYAWLLDLCLAGHEVLCGLFGLSPATRLSSELGHADAGRTERLVRICRDLGATRYVSGDAARDYMEEQLWTQAGIDLVYHCYPHPTYAQRGQPFVSHLSVVDALMFCGPAVREFVGISHSKEGRGPVIGSSPT